MTDADEAAYFDRHDMPVDAARAYESALNDAGASLELYLSLAVLYFQCVDGGYLAHHQLPVEFVDQAWRRANEVLTEAEHRFGGDAEIEFWRHYFRFIVLGAAPFYRVCEELARTSSSLTPYLHLLSSADGEEYREKAEQLLKEVEDGATVRKRYIKSVLESGLRALNMRRHMG